MLLFKYISIIYHLRRNWNGKIEHSFVQFEHSARCAAQYIPEISARTLDIPPPSCYNESSIYISEGIIMTDSNTTVKTVGGLGFASDCVSAG